MVGINSRSPKKDEDQNEGNMNERSCTVSKSAAVVVVPDMSLTTQQATLSLTSLVHPSEKGLKIALLKGNGSDESSDFSLANRVTDYQWCSD